MRAKFKKVFVSPLVVLAVAIWSTCALAVDYPKKINFQNLMQNRDIALGEVEAILQDYEGFMWLGGRNGLLRYDGYDMVPIMVEKDPADPTTNVPANQVIDLFEDSHKKLWVATRSGLLQYDRDREILVHLHQQNGQPLQTYTETVNTVVEAATGEMLAGAYLGLTIIDPKTLNAETLTHNPADASTLPNNVIHDIHVDANQTVWLGSDAGLIRMEWPSKRWTLHVPNPENPSSLPDNGIWVIASDHSGSLWAGTHNGLLRFDAKSQTFVRYQHDPNDRFSLGGNLIRDIYVDNDGLLWAGSDSGGVSLYNPEQDRFIRFQSELGKEGTLSSNSIRRIYQDRNSDIWIGTYPAGVNYHDRSTAAITSFNFDAEGHGLLADNVEALVEDQAGNLWIGAAGVTRYNPAEDSFTHYTNRGRAPKISSTSIISGLVDSDGDIWFGTWAAGFHRYNREADRFEQIPFDASLALAHKKTTDRLNADSVWDIYEDRQKNIWISTHTGGLSRYDKNTGIFTNYSQTAGDPTSLNNQLVWTTFEDSQGRFWVGTASGLNLMDREAGTFKLYAADADKPGALVNGSILAIFEDRQGRLWFGTDGGLHLYHPDTDTFDVFNTKDGFVDNGVRSIVEDADGNLWLATNNGVVMFNFDNRTVRNFRRHNGQAIGGFSTGAAVATHDGLLAFGGKSGLRIFDPAKLGINQTVPPLVITDFRIFTKPVPLNGPDKILSRVINQTDAITLDYTKTMFSFNFAALNFRDPEKNQYAYKLEGFDDKWREVGNQRSALYTNLSAGKYTFRVKGSNNDGVWNETGKAIEIRQLPPPWRTWWAHTIYALIVIGIIVQFIRSQRRKRRLVEEQNRILEIKVAERTSELRAKNNDIQAMLGNMRQGLFTVVPGGQIHPEYSRYLEDIFATREIAGRDVMDLLFSKAKIGSNTFDQVKEAINSMIGEDEMNYDFNSHLLLQEYEADFDGEIKYLSLDWNPILDDGMVAKLMVSVRDVTQLKQMEAEARSKKRELDIISQLLNISAKKYLAFVESTKRFVAENRDKILATTTRDDSVIALLFRNMHTVKGNCRTFGFSCFSDVVHEVESAYSQMKNSADVEWNQEKLLADLLTVEATLAEYERVYYTILGRGNSAGSGRDPNGFWADSKVLKIIQESLDTTYARFPAVKAQDPLLPVQVILDKATSAPVSQVLKDVVESLPSMAQQLDKEPPSVTIDDQNVRIKNSAQELMTNIFAHILRNSIDHGIETPAERIAAGKPERGVISIRPHIGHTRAGEKLLQLYVRDDGRGLNIDRLLQKGVELGRWQTGDTPTYGEVAQLIFVSGVSTKDQVSDISGRGVGMDAVRQFLVQQGGDIALQVEDADRKVNSDFSGPRYASFVTLVSLPDKVFIQMA